MVDPIVLNQTMPSQEYAHYVAYWDSRIVVCFVFLTALALAVLLSVRAFIVEPLRASIDEATWAIRAGKPGQGAD